MYPWLSAVHGGLYEVNTISEKPHMLVYDSKVRSHR